jgi:hypothetical protein
VLKYWNETFYFEIEKEGKKGISGNLESKGKVFVLISLILSIYLLSPNGCIFKA